MFKKQMKCQKLLCYLALVMAAVLFVYAIGFSTDWFDLMFTTLDLDLGIDYSKVDGTQFFWEIESPVIYKTVKETADDGSLIQRTVKVKTIGFNDQLVTVALIDILVTLLLFIMNTHKRRKYYVGNFVAVGAVVAYNTGVSLWLMERVSYFKNKFLTEVDFEALEKFCTRKKITYNISTRCCDAGTVIAIVMIVLSVLLVLNVVWKLMIVKAENNLLKNGASEVQNG